MTESNIAESEVELAPRDQSAQADVVIKNHMLIAMAGGLIPLPAVDLAVLVANQVKMVHNLADVYGIPFQENRVKSAVISLVGGSVPVLGVIALSGAKIMPGIGSLVGSGGVALSGGATTYAVGRVFANHFEQGGDMADFKASKMRGIFRREVKKGKEEAQAAKEQQSDIKASSVSPSSGPKMAGQPA